MFALPPISDHWSWQGLAAGLLVGFCAAPVLISANLFGAAQPSRRRRRPSRSVLPPDVYLDPPLRPGEPSRRRYRLIYRRGLFGWPVIGSRDAPMSDPETHRFWIRADVAAFAIGGVSLIAYVLSRLT